MPVKVATLKELASGEARVALVPETAAKFLKLKVELLLQDNAGASAFFANSAYAGVQIVKTAQELLRQGDIVLKVQAPTEKEIESLRPGTLVIAFMQAHLYPKRIALLRDRKINSLAMELVPRISRAQSMDALSSQASLAGYKAALLAANRLGQFFPMLTTAAGTLRPARVLVIGAGVAGLQAIATCKRLGAVVEAYDVRGATKEQVESLGAKFVSPPMNAEGVGGYARELSEAEKQQQQDLLAHHLSLANVVISTAAIPGKPSPKLITDAMVQSMRPGSVIIDLAAEGGGNCVLSQPGECVERHGVFIDAPLNVASQLPVHASEMYAKNLFNLLQPMIKDGELNMNWDDEVIRGCTLTRDGKILHEPTRLVVEGVK